MLSDLTYEQTTRDIYEYLKELLYHFAGPDKFKISKKLIDTKFLILLKKMPEIKPLEPNRKYTIEYSAEGINEPLESGYIKLFKTMKIEVQIDHALEAVYKLGVEKREGENIFYIEHPRGYEFKCPVKDMLSIQDGEEIPSEPIDF